MKRNAAFQLISIVVCIFAGARVLASIDTTEQFTIAKSIAVTSVKNQYKSNTCWSYSVLAMLEAELIKDGKSNIDLSEMYIVHKVYQKKAERFIRLHGHMSFTGGGALNDPLDIIDQYGLMPESAYSGLKDGTLLPDHISMDDVLSDFVDGLIKNKKISPEWREGFIGILNAYIGKIPETFMYNGKEYTPRMFADEMAIKKDNYSLFTSFNYKPYYSRMTIDVPDNWSNGQAYNVPLNDMIAIIDNAINQGYTVAIAADVSEPGFQWQKGMAVAFAAAVNNEDVAGMPGIWLPKADSGVQVIKEIGVDEKIRQAAFDNYETTDDHGLLITGIAHDQKGKKFYIVKNSWGTDGSPFNGYIYMSETYVKYKTLSFLVNKKCIPSNIAQKLVANCDK